jgi:hypothetical protein
MWGVHNTRLMPWNNTLKCPMCVHLINNGHMAEIAPQCRASGTTATIVRFAYYSHY